MSKDALCHVKKIITRKENIQNPPTDISLSPRRRKSPPSYFLTFKLLDILNTYHVFIMTKN